MLTPKQIFFKRGFDVLFAFFGLILFTWLILILMLIIYFGAKEKGIFVQNRVGQYGHVFKIYKIKSLYGNPKLMNFSKFIRKTKLDELPQLWNVLIGDMSVVGPRPDLEGFADQLKGNEKVMLKIKPGLTGPASLVFYNEEELLSKQVNKEEYNREVIWKKKVALNITYINNYSFAGDLKYILKTLTRLFNH